MSAFLSPRLIRGAAGLLSLALLWEVFARSDIFPRSLTPTIDVIVMSFVYMVMNGTIFINIAYTVMRLAMGLAIACVIAIPLGLAMGRFGRVETVFQAPLSVLMPIPTLAWVPLFILWFGLGNTTTILIVAYAAVFPMVYNIWSGVRSINPIWLRAAVGMGSNAATLFWRIIFPASLPFVVTGLRLSYGRAWIAVIGGELLAGTDWGLGRLIFESKEWLATGDMLSTIACIGAIALASERLIFQAIDRRTVVKWGMVSSER